MTAARERLQAAAVTDHSPMVHVHRCDQCGSVCRGGVAVDTDDQDDEHFTMNAPHHVPTLEAMMLDTVRVAALVGPRGQPLPYAHRRDHVEILLRRWLGGALTRGKGAGWPVYLSPVSMPVCRVHLCKEAAGEAYCELLREAVHDRTGGVWPTARGEVVAPASACCRISHSQRVAALELKLVNV